MKEKFSINFWTGISREDEQLKENELKYLWPFTITELADGQTFLFLYLFIKIKYRNKLNSSSDLLLYLTSVESSLKIFLNISGILCVRILLLTSLLFIFTATAKFEIIPIIFIIYFFSYEGYNLWKWASKWYVSQKRLGIAKLEPTLHSYNAIIVNTTFVRNFSFLAQKIAKLEI